MHVVFNNGFLIPYYLMEGEIKKVVNVMSKMDNVVMPTMAKISGGTLLKINPQMNRGRPNVRSAGKQLNSLKISL